MNYIICINITLPWEIINKKRMKAWNFPDEFNQIDDLRRLLLFVHRKSRCSILLPYSNCKSWSWVPSDMSRGIEVLSRQKVIKLVKVRDLVASFNRVNTIKQRREKQVAKLSRKLNLYTDIRIRESYMNHAFLLALKINPRSCHSFISLSATSVRGLLKSSSDSEHYPIHRRLRKALLVFSIPCSGSKKRMKSRTCAHSSVFCLILLVL